MAHVDSKDLYALYYALLQHRSGSEAIAGLTLDQEVSDALGRTKADRFRQPPHASHALTHEEVIKQVRHATKCHDCKLIVLEEGPYAERIKSAEDLREEDARRALEESRLTRRFCIALVYSVVCFAGAQWARGVYLASKVVQPTDSGPTVTAVNDQALKIHPMLIVFAILIGITAWGLADAWTIANNLWLDWTRAKEAVPLIGKKWAARSRAKKAGKG